MCSLYFIDISNHLHPAQLLLIVAVLMPPNEIRHPISNKTDEASTLGNSNANRQLIASVFCFFTILLSSLWTGCGHRCRPFFPLVLSFDFYRAKGSAIALLVGFSSSVANSRSRAFRTSICAQNKSPRICTSMHAGEFEPTKLTYTRLEDNLIRYRGDRHIVWKLSTIWNDPGQKKKIGRLL